ncbi:MAG: phosphatidylserine/phosphatidylglycerophosphate/cardiolipin synthase family protein [Candidatus Ornithospirochaeta sp.]
MKIRVFVLVLLSVLVASCSSTKAFVAEETVSKEITLSEKLEYYGGREVLVDEPEMFFTGEEWLEKITEEVEKAEDYVLMSVYLGSVSPRLENLYSLLEEKAKSGVRVYLIVDGSSNMDMTDTKFVMTPVNYLRDSGVNVTVYSPMSFSHVINPKNLLVRDHRKLMVFDGKVAVLGGMNLNYISIGAGEENQRDSMYLFHSPDLAAALVEEFVSSWNSMSLEEIDASSFATSGEGEGEFKAWLFNSNIYSGDVSMSGMFGSLINEASSTITLFPFLPAVDKNMEASLKAAVDRGVEVKMYCSEDPRTYLKKGMAYGRYKLVSSTGADYYNVTFDEDGNEYPLFHMKMMVVDDRYLVVGSSNFNFRSMAMSHEIAIVIDSPSIAVKAKEKALESAGNPVLVSEETLKAIDDEMGSFLGFLIVFFGG